MNRSPSDVACFTRPTSKVKQYSQNVDRVRTDRNGLELKNEVDSEERIAFPLCEVRRATDTVWPHNSKGVFRHGARCCLRLAQVTRLRVPSSRCQRRACSDRQSRKPRIQSHSREVRRVCRPQSAVMRKTMLGPWETRCSKQSCHWPKRYIQSRRELEPSTRVPDRRRVSARTN